MAIGSIFFPVAVVAGAVKPNLDSTAFADVSAYDPLALIFGAVVELDNGALFFVGGVDLGVAVIEWLELFSEFLQKLITGVKFYLHSRLDCYIDRCQFRG